MGLFGTCVECREASGGWPDSAGDFYCSVCWRQDALFDSLRSYRCFTFCVVYDARTLRRLSVGGSVNDVCAERNALWNLASDHVSTPKVLVVCRLRRSKGRRRTLGYSKPCAQCICAMQLYNVSRVCFSGKDRDFVWHDVSSLTSDYFTKSQTIVSMGAATP